MFLVDGNMLAIRCVRKMDFLKSSAGVPTGLEYGMLRSLESLQKKYPEQRITICFDVAGNKRKLESKTYKANRPKPDESFYKRLNHFKKFLNCFWTIAYAPGFEADDVMFSLVNCEPGPHFIYTNDSDLAACIDNVRQIKVVKSFQSQLYEWTEETVRSRFGVGPKGLAIYRAFAGDKSDNIIGVPRIKKQFLAELITWSRGEMHTPAETAQEIKTAKWSEKLIGDVREFVDSGKWLENYKLIELRHPDNTELHPWNLDSGFVVECLLKWEIRKLKLCEQFRGSLADVVKNEEF